MNVIQAELMRFLQDPASYPHRPVSVRLVQTHASLVALVGDLVYKVKKPVDFGFLDYATLAKRKHFCEREVELNRRLCSGVYEGVVPIRRQGGRLAFEGAGPVVEYAVKMKRLASEGFLDVRLARGEAGHHEIDLLVEKLAAFYRQQASTPEIAAWGAVDRLRLSTDENAGQTEPFVGQLLSRAAFDAVHQATEAFYTRHGDLLERRCLEGHILDCHGDLRAEHVHFSRTDVCVYDCIEFNERFRYIDVASDLAFLAMDLRFIGHPELGRYLTHRMADALGDVDLPRLLPFYASYRAYVRGKVEGMRSEEGEVPPPERAASRERARRYFRLALDYALTGGRPAVLVVMGRVGTGKSTVAKALAEALGWEVASSDRVRKAMAGVPLYERGNADERARLYAGALTARTYAALLDEAVANARSGRSTVLDATFSRRCQREALRRAFDEADVPYLVVELTAPAELLRERLRQREGAPVLSDARVEDFDPLNVRYEEPSRFEEPNIKAISTQTDAEQTVSAVLASVRRRGWISG